MKIKRYASCRDYLKDIEPLLLENEYLNNLMLGILYKSKGKPATSSDLYLMINHEDRFLVGLIAGLYLILYANTDLEELYEQLVNYLMEHEIQYPGIIGPVACCETFRKVYESKTKQSMKLLMNQRIFVINEVKQFTKLESNIELAKASDVDYLKDWMFDFLEVAKENPTYEHAKHKVEELISSKSLYLLRYKDEIVSMAASTRPLMNGVSVSFVYTPNRFRNHGFASKCVELLTEKLLKSYDYCTLYTDLSNPTSNSIYQKIGYRPVGDSAVYVI